MKKTRTWNQILEGRVTKGVFDKLRIWKGALKTQKGESCSKRSTTKIPWEWSEFKSTDGRQYLWYEQTCRRSQENRRISSKTTPRKDRNLSKERIDYPLSEGRLGQNKSLVKEKFEDRE